MKILRPTIMLASMLAASASLAQTTRSGRDASRAYGARVINPSSPGAALNTRRVNNRINNRINNRVASRIEPSEGGAAADPTAAYRAATTATATSAKAFEQASSDANRNATSAPQ